VKHIAIIGGGPSGLRAAECAAAGAVDVTLFDSKPSVGRKFLVAGKGGLNLTHSEPLDIFCKRYSPAGGDSDFWEALLSYFPPQAFRDWAMGLGVETFVAGSGRVYLKNHKAAALLRSWIARLKILGVRFAMKHRLVSITPGDPLQLTFSNGATTSAYAVILAMGGGSWPRTGSDGEWMRIFEGIGIATSPLSAANCGWGM
jgi:predicted Rossmann fold flavoprotein